MKVLEKEKEGKEKDNGTLEVVTSAEFQITKNDITNLKIEFDLAIQASTKDRQGLASIITFENSLVEKLKNFLSKYNK